MKLIPTTQWLTDIDIRKCKQYIRDKMKKRVDQKYLHKTMVQLCCYQKYNQCFGSRKLVQFWTYSCSVVAEEALILIHKLESWMRTPWAGTRRHSGSQTLWTVLQKPTPPWGRGQLHKPHKFVSPYLQKTAGKHGISAGMWCFWQQPRAKDANIKNSFFYMKLVCLEQKTVYISGSLVYYQTWLLFYCHRLKTVYNAWSF